MTPVQYRSYTNVLNIDKDIVPDLRYKIVTCEYIINLNSFFNIVMEYLMYISMKMGLTVMFQAGFVQTIAFTTPLLQQSLRPFSTNFWRYYPAKINYKNFEMNRK